MSLARLPLLLLAVLAAGCDSQGPGSAETDPTPISLSPLGEDLVGQSNAFGVRLFARTAAETDENVMLSPLSASVALTMLLNGADGQTRAQILALLDAPDGADPAAVNESHRVLRDQLLAADPEVSLALANAVFYRDTFGPSVRAPFLEAMRGPFAARVEGLDFGSPAALEAINGWASASTAGRVPTVLDELSPDLVMALLNAVYFKGTWTTQFDPADTRPGDFHLAGGQTVQTPMMWGTVPALTVQGDGYSALELPYGRRNFSFVVMMPDEGTLGDFAAGLEAGTWTDVAARLDAHQAWGDVLVALPRFSFSSETVLNSQLQALGMVDAFQEGVANLSRISEDSRIVVSTVKQDAFIDVNEEGTEAAAVTTVEIVDTSAGPGFVADRPFVFAIRERTTNTLLFIGQLTDPS